MAVCPDCFTKGYALGAPCPSCGFSELKPVVSSVSGAAQGGGPDSSKLLEEVKLLMWQLVGKMDRIEKGVAALSEGMEILVTEGDK